MATNAVPVSVRHVLDRPCYYKQCTLSDITAQRNTAERADVITGQLIPSTASKN